MLAQGQAANSTNSTNDPQLFVVSLEFVAAPVLQDRLTVLSEADIVAVLRAPPKLSQREDISKWRQYQHTGGD